MVIIDVEHYPEQPDLELDGNDKTDTETDSEDENKSKDVDIKSPDVDIKYHNNLYSFLVTLFKKYITSINPYNICSFPILIMR
jgi:hypothetical protein